MSRSTPAAFASRAMICTISSRTSPLPPGNWCDARNVTGVAAAVPASSAAVSAASTSIRLNFLIWLLLRIGWFSLVAYHDEALVTNVVWLALRDEAPIISESRTCPSIGHSVSPVRAAGVSALYRANGPPGDPQGLETGQSETI